MINNPNTRIKYLICAIIIMLLVLTACEKTEVSKVKETAADTSATKTQIVETQIEAPNALLADEQILAKYDDGLDEAVKELDALE